MEITKIDKNSFKISLDSKEARENKIPVWCKETNKLNIDETVKAFVEKISEENGMILGKEKPNIEIYVSKDGGCDIFVSKTLTERNANKNGAKNAIFTVYGFSDFSSLANSVEKLQRFCFENPVSLYFDKSQKRYYLVLSGIHYRDMKYAFLAEHGFRVKNNCLTYITEYFDCICKNNVIKKFANLL